LNFNHGKKEEGRLRYGCGRNSFQPSPNQLEEESIKRSRGSYGTMVQI
jgi:hypothetical protein